MKPVVVFGCYLLPGTEDNTVRQLSETVFTNSQRRCQDASMPEPKRASADQTVMVESWVRLYLKVPDAPKSTLCKLLNQLVAASVLPLMSLKGPVHPNEFVCTVVLAVHCIACGCMMSPKCVFWCSCVMSKSWL